MGILDDLRSLNKLAYGMYSWPVPDARLSAADQELVQLARIMGSVGVMAEGTKEQAAEAIRVAKAAETLRGSPVVLAVLFRPWLVPVQPGSSAAFEEFSRLTHHWSKVAAALSESSYKPPVVALVDTETFDARTEPKRSQVKLLYETAAAQIKSFGVVGQCWYSFAEIAAPADPDGYAHQAWSVPFVGLEDIGFETYTQHEIAESRIVSRQANALRADLEVRGLTAWVSFGCGRRYTFQSFKEWVWQAASVQYTRELGRELCGAWYRARPRRFHAGPTQFAVYPHVLDARAQNALSQFVEFCRGAQE